MPAAAGSATERVLKVSGLPWAVLGAGILASLVLFTVIRNNIESEAEARFERQASDAKHVIEARIQSYADILYGVRALFATHSPISRFQFHRLVDSLDLKNRYPGFEVVNYAINVRAEDKERFEEAVRRDTSLDPGGYPNFAIKPQGERPEYHVLVYLEPMAGNEFAFGLDLFSGPKGGDPRAWAAEREAQDSGRLTVSGRLIRVMRAKEFVGLAMRLAVYRSGVPLDTIEDRRAAYIGSVGAGFNVENLMRGVLNQETSRYIRFRLYDAGPASERRASSYSRGERLLFDTSQLIQAYSAQSDIDSPDNLFNRVLPIEIGGRIWEAQFSGRKDVIIDRVDRILPWLVLASGLLSSALLTGMFYSLASSRSRAVEIANVITKDLRDSTEQLQAMSRRLVDVQESERRRFSRELHDQVGQNITALSINLDILKTQLPANGNETLRTRLSDAAALLESTAGSIENVMSELRPPMLDDYGLLPALQWYADEFSNRTGIQVTVNGDEGIERLPQASEIALFRIMQEALNNVAKHAHASRVRIALERAGTQFSMSISDDGVGFDTAPVAASRRRPGLGMVTMRERTQAVGGEFEIGAASGRGTRVVVRVPC